MLLYLLHNQVSWTLRKLRTRYYSKLRIGLLGLTDSDRLNLIDRSIERQKGQTANSVSYIREKKKKTFLAFVKPGLDRG